MMKAALLKSALKLSPFYSSLQYNAPEEPVSIECVMSLVPGEGTVKVQTVVREIYDRGL